MTISSINLNRILPRNASDRKIALWIGGFLLVLSLVLYFINGTLTDDGAGFYFFLSTVAITWGLADRTLFGRTLWVLLLPLVVAVLLPKSISPIISLLVLFVLLGVQLYSLRCLLEPHKTWFFTKRIEQPWWILPVIVSTLPFFLSDRILVQIVVAVAILVVLVRADALDRDKGLWRLLLTLFVFVIAVPVIVHGFLIDSIYRQLYFPKYIRNAVSFNSILLIVGSLLMMVRIVTTPVIKSIRFNSPIRNKLIFSFLFSSIIPFIMMGIVVLAGVFVWMNSFYSRITKAALMEPCTELAEYIHQLPEEGDGNTDSITVLKSRYQPLVMRYEQKRILGKTGGVSFRYTPVDSSLLFRSFTLSDSVTTSYNALSYDGTRYNYFTLVKLHNVWNAAARPLTANDLQRCKKKTGVDLKLFAASETPRKSQTEKKAPKLKLTLNKPDSSNTNMADSKLLLSTLSDTVSTKLRYIPLSVGFMLIETLPYSGLTANVASSGSTSWVILYQSLDGIYNTLSGSDNVVVRAFYVGQLFISIFVIIIILVAINIGFQISRLITASSDKLITGTLALRRGELEHRIPVESKDELGEIAYSFNLMAADISRMLVEIREKERIQRDLDIARSIQIGLLPNEPPRLDGWEIAARSDFAQDVGGDFYDFIPMAHHRIAITLGDVSGKGIPAAMLMANVQATIRALCSMYDDPRKIVIRLNEELVRTTAPELFATLFFALLDSSTGKMHYVNAGHDRPYLWQSGSIHELSEGGTVVGAFAGMDYGVGTIQLTPDDRLLVFSDGITEAGVNTENTFGSERLRETFISAVDKTADDELSALFEKVNLFAAGAPPSDDRTVICVRKR